MPNEAAPDHGDQVRGHAVAVLDDGAAAGVDMTAGVSYARRQRESADRVEAAAALAALSDQLLLAAVAAERSHGASWAVIGKALGVTRSAAHGRFADAIAQYSVAGGAGDGREVAQGATAKAFERLRRLWDKVAETATRESSVASLLEATVDNQLSAEASPAAAPNLVVCGPPGSGKTKIIAELIQTLRSEHHGRVLIVSTTSPDLVSALEQADGSGEGATPTDAASPLTGGSGSCVQYDVTPDDVLVTALPPAGTPMQGPGRMARRLKVLEAQMKSILERLPDGDEASSPGPRA